jgi:hypothetical protein
LAIDHLVEVVGGRNISRFHSYLVRASTRRTASSFNRERLTGALVVFELDHRLTLLEPFKIVHKGKFVSSTAFEGATPKVNVIAPFMWHCSKSKLREIAH